MADILFKTDDYIFSYRVGGVLIHNGKVLMQNAEGDDGYAFIGGHVAFGETTDETLVREFKEEIGANINIERLLMVNENFFPWGNKPCQQINLYYLISLKDETQIPLDRNFKALDDLGNERSVFAAIGGILWNRITPAYLHVTQEILPIGYVGAVIIFIGIVISQTRFRRRHKPPQAGEDTL